MSAGNDEHDLQPIEIHKNKERNEALFSLDRARIEAYLKKYGESDAEPVSETIFWAGVYKAICAVKGAPEDLVIKARIWLFAHGFSSTITTL